MVHSSFIAGRNSLMTNFLLQSGDMIKTLATYSAVDGV